MNFSQSIEYAKKLNFFHLQCDIDFFLKLNHYINQCEINVMFNVF